MHLRRRLARAAALGLALLAAAPLRAGLVFKRAPAPRGADVSSLAGDGSRLFAGTIRGVWRLESGTWTFDGLGAETITSVAVAGGTAFAADGTHVYRRLSALAWAIEDPSPLPSAFPSVLVASGDVLYAAGVGAFKRVGGVWSALPDPGHGLARSATVTGAGELVLGFGDGSAAIFSGGIWTTLEGGMGFDETVQALTTAGGVLYAGTNLGVYARSGSTWVFDAALGRFDVRALTSTGGALRAATVNDGVYVKVGAIWLSDNPFAFLTRRDRCFATNGSDLYLGTAGGPVYRFTEAAGWVEVKDALDAAVVTGVDAFGFVTTRGAGAASLSGSPFAVGSGCGSLVAGGTFGDGHDAFALSDKCGAVTEALPNGTFAGIDSHTVFTDANDAGLVATAGSGVFVFSGSFSPLDNGLPDSASVNAVRDTPAGVFAALGSSIFKLGALGVWGDVSDGLPGTPVVSIGGTAKTTWAGLSAGGVVRRDGSGIWRADAAGVATATVFSLDATAQGPAAAVGTGRVRVKRGGGWVPEMSGFPDGADVRVVRVADGNLYAGTAGSGLFVAPTDPSVRTIPVVLDVVGNAGAHFRTELTIGSRGTQPATVHVTFTPAPGFGAPEIGGTVDFALAPGTELRAADALDFLRDSGLTIPAATPSAPIAGSLSVVADGYLGSNETDFVYAIARTYTKDAKGGTYGLFYDAPSDLEAAEDQGWIYGLRSVANVSRSNLAMVHLPGRSTDPITLAVHVFTAAGVESGPAIPVTLQPGEWRQLNGILALAGLGDGFAYARIERTAGTGPWTAYGVVNDAKTSDGSYLPLFRPGGLTAARKLLVPVVLDVFGAQGSHFTTELTLVNDGPIATPVDLFYQPAPGGGSAPGVPFVTVSLAAREQRTIPDVIQYLRDNGVHVPSPTTGAQVGTLEVSFRFLGNLDAPRTVALARTSTPNTNAAVGGAFGLFYSAIALGGGARSSAIVPALTEDASARSNLALVHAGGGSSLPIGLKVELHDAATGAKVGSTITATLNPGDWVQYSKVLTVAGAAPGTTRAYAVVTRTSGDDGFYAYGVLNDNVTSDGSFLPMIAADRD